MKRVPELPEAYTNVHPANIPKKPSPPPTVCNPIPAPQSIQSYLKEEFAWLEEDVSDSVSITWSAHHAARKRSKPFEVSISALMPLLRDQAHSVATMKHAMKKICDTVAFLNPGQIPVIAAGQPLYALAKQIQWTWPEYGENKCLLMFGGLHIEMAALRSLGTLLQDSGWTNALVEAGVASPGIAESFLTASNVTRTRQAHQITACGLYLLMKEAYQDFCSADSGQSALSFEDWCQKRKVESPQFEFWITVLDFDRTVFILIRYFREGDFDLYHEALSGLSLFSRTKK